MSNLSNVINLIDASNQFFPTTSDVAAEMVEQLEPKSTHKILDPSAGTGVLLEKVQEKIGSRHYAPKMYAIEIDPNLRLILQAKSSDRDTDFNVKVIGSDFLKYDEPISYDRIIMNPPFANGVVHVLKAWQILADGGRIVSLLNKETITNPYSKQRMILKHLIEQYGSVKDMKRCFVESDHPTDVEVVMVVLNKPKKEKTNFGEKFNSDSPIGDDQPIDVNPLASANLIHALVDQYKKAQSLLIQRHELNKQLKFYLPSDMADYSLKSAYNIEPILSEEIKTLKNTFWSLVFSRAKIAQRTTSKFQKDFEAFQNTQANMAFSVENISEMLLSFFSNYDDIMLDSMIKQFDSITAYHKENRIYPEGWKTNEGWKIANKIIWPYGVNADSWSVHTCSGSYDFLSDLDRIFCYLSGKKFPEDVTLTTYRALSDGCTRKCFGEWLESDFFKIKFFKKGTIHLVAKDSKILEEFNLRVARGKNWIGGKDF